MLLNAHAGARYGIPFPVFARASFGVLGANMPRFCARWSPAAGSAFKPGSAAKRSTRCLSAMIRAGISPGCGFLLPFLAAESRVIRARHRNRSATCRASPRRACWFSVVAMLGWAYVESRRARANALDALEIPDVRRIFRFFVPSLTGVVAFWATVALNIPDFTRYAKGQREQMLGQALGLPDYDDVLFFHRHRGDFRNGDYLRPGHLGSGSGAEPTGKSSRGGGRDARAAAGHAQRERRGQRRLARKRFFESLSAADQFQTSAA